MYRWKNRCLAALLVLTMLLTSVPMPVFAEDSAVLEAESAHHTVSLTIGGADTPLDTLYLTDCVTYTQVYDIPLPAGNYPSTSRLQVVQNGRVVATSDGTDFYYDEEDDGFIMDYETLYFLEQPKAGEAALQVRTGDAESAQTVTLPTKVQVVADPLLTSAYLYQVSGNLYRCSLEILNYVGMPEDYILTLSDSNGQAVETAASLTEIHSDSDGSVNLYYDIQVSGAMTEGEVYTLHITRPKGNLYSMADTVRITPELGGIPEIASVTVDDSVTGGILVQMANLDPKTACTLQVEMDNSLLYNGPLTVDESGLASVVLRKNGLCLPLSSQFYSSRRLNLEVFETETESWYCYGELELPNTASRMHSEAELTKLDSSFWAFKVEGTNMLYDLYAQENCTFRLRHFSYETDRYIDIGTLAGPVEKSMKSEYNADIYTFRGLFSVTNPVDYDLEIWAGEERIAHTYLSDSGPVEEETPVVSTETEVEDWNYYHNVNGDSLHFMLGRMKVTATIHNSCGKATVNLCDSEGNAVLTSGEVTGVLRKDGLYDYTFYLPDNGSLSTDKSYTFRLLENGKVLEESYESMPYDSEVVLPGSWIPDEHYLPVGTDTVLLFEYGLQNVTEEQILESLPAYIEKMGSGEKIALSVAGYPDSAYHFDVEMKTAKPLTFGTYRFTFGEYDVRDIYIIPMGGAVLGDVTTQYDYTPAENAVVDCENLPEGKYIGRIFRNTDDGSVDTGREVSLTRVSDSKLTIDDLPDDLMNQTGYQLSVWCGEKFLDTIGFYVNRGGMSGEATAKFFTTFHYLLETEHGWMRQYETYYVTPSRQVTLGVYRTGMPYWRYSESKDELKNLPYRPNRGEEFLELSEGEGEKTIYFQLRAPDGTESTVYAIPCCYKPDSDGQLAILGGEFYAGDTRLDLLLPENTEVAVRVTVNDRLADLYAFPFHMENGSAQQYYDRLDFRYVGESETGSVFEAVLHTGEYPYYYDDYNWSFLRVFAYTPVGYGEITMDLPMNIGELTSVQLNLEHTTYTNLDGFTVTGMASANSTVTVSLGERIIAVETDGSGKFSAKLPAGLEEGRYVLTATDSKGLTTDRGYTVVVDKTAPELVRFVASLADETGNANLSWEAWDESGCHFLLWRDDTLLLADRDNYTKQDYIDVGAGEFGVSYTLVAVDRAGNRSEPATSKLGDNEPPTTPGEPLLMERGCGFLDFCWEPSEDNFGVECYVICRNGEPIAEVSADTPFYYDTNLEMGKTYAYSVQAVDLFGNVSEISVAELTTAALVIQREEPLESLYYRQVSLPNDYVSVTLQAQEQMNTNGVHGALEYRLVGTESWTAMELTKSDYSTTYSAKWEYDKMAAGSYEMRYRLWEGENECVGPTYMVEIRDDDIAPTVTLYRPTAESTHGGSWEISISGEAEDNISVSTVELAYSTDGKTFVPLKTEQIEPWDTYVSCSHLWTPGKVDGAVTIRATATDLCGNTAQATQTIYVDSTAPADAKDFAAYGSSRYIRLDWSYDFTEPDFRGFNIYRAESPEGPFVLLNQTPNYGIGYADDGETIENIKTYYYYVTAVDKYDNESVGTPVLAAQMIQDNESPVIREAIPSDGANLCYKAPVAVYATDNYRLALAVIHYRLKGSSAWIRAGEIPVENAANSEEFYFDWDLRGLKGGEYEVRIRVYDDSIHDVDEGYTANDPAEVIRTVTVRQYTAPVKPNVKARSDYRKVELTWTYSGDASLLWGFHVQKLVDGEYVTVKTRNPKNMFYTDEVSLSETNNSYRIIAVDQYDETAISAVVTGGSIGKDTEPPVVKLSPETVLAAVNTPCQFSASGSTDNDEIVSYSWSFGDGGTGTGLAPTHTYTASGSYTVTLTVTDAFGNSTKATAAVTVMDVGENADAYTLVTFETVDNKKQPVANVQLTVSDDEQEWSVVTGKDGKVKAMLPHGAYNLSAVAGGYMPRNASLTLLPQPDGTQTVTIALTDTGIIAGELTAKEMTMEEIREAGIDVNDPDNQHVWKYAVELTFHAGLMEYSVPFNFFGNGGGYFGGRWFYLGSGGGVYEEEEESDGKDDNIFCKIGIFPITEQFYMVIYGEAHWLKEMYNVELVVVNQSGVDSLTGCTAELYLPDGLSLADMVGYEQTFKQRLQDLQPGETTATNWYVRGDKEGEYHLSASVDGFQTSGGLSSPFSALFTTSEPLKVYAGSALHMTVIADDLAQRGEDYHVTFVIQNVSDKPLYNFSFGVTGIEQYKILNFHKQEGTVSTKLPLDKQEFGEDFTQLVPELAPGGYVQIDIATTCWFNSALEVATRAYKAIEKYKLGFNVLGSFLDVAYYLDNVNVVTLEGSTTTVPSDVIINHVPRPTIIQKAVDEIIGEFIPKNPIDLVQKIVEVSGVDLEPFELAIDAGKDVISLQQGATDTTFKITINDGKGNGNSLSNENFKITTYDGTEMFFEGLNTAVFEVKTGGTLLELEGLKPGESMLTVETNCGGEITKFEIPVFVTDDKVVTKQPVSGSLTAAQVPELVGAISENEETLNPNPFHNIHSNLYLSDEGEDAAVTMEAGVLQSILKETGLSSVTVAADSAEVTLNKTVLTDLGGAETTVLVDSLGKDTYDLQLQKDGKPVTDFGTGIATVSFQYEAEDWVDPATVTVEYVHEDGTVEVMDAAYDPETGKVTFKTNHFSVYRVVRREGITNLTHTETEETMTVTFDLDAPHVEDGVIYVAFYREDGRMLYTTAVALDNFANGRVHPQRVTVTLPYIPNTHEVRTFLLDSTHTPKMQPDSELLR